MTRLLAPIVALAFLLGACGASESDETLAAEAEVVTVTETETETETETVTETETETIEISSTSVPESCLRVAENLEFMTQWSYEYTTAVYDLFTAIADNDMAAMEAQVPVILDLNERLTAKADSDDIQGILPDCRAGR